MAIELRRLALATATAILTASYSLSASAAPPSPPGTTIVDGRGQELGHVFDGSTLQMNINNTWLQVQFSSNGFSVFPNAQSFFVYLTSDCSGDAYL